MAIDFDWKDVQIDSENKTISINGNKYSFDQVSGAELQFVNNCWGRPAAGTITFRVKDLKQPLHKIKVHSVFGDIDQNYERICMLLNLNR